MHIEKIAGVRPVAVATGRPAVIGRGLSKSFGEVAAVVAVDLAVESGEIVAVLGPNGAGKSTLNEMLTGLVRPDRGTVEIFGLEPRAAVRCGLTGALLQAGALLHEATVSDLLALVRGLHAHPLPLAKVIERAGMGDILKTKTDKLSGGQAQRVRYALAIMGDPRLLILDEPTVGMDVEMRRAFWASMRDFAAEGRTVLFATHYLEEADQVADRIVVLAEGRVVANGTGSTIRSLVAGRTISLAADGLDLGGLERLPGALRTETTGRRVLVHTGDSDATLRALLESCPDAHDIEIGSARLEDAFLALTTRRPETDLTTTRERR